jgi:hypothetical protein
MNKKNEIGTLVPMTVTEGVTVNVLPSEQYEYLMTTREVALGYGVSIYAVRKTLLRNSSELIESKHFISGGDILSSPKNGLIQHNSTLWTKRGIVRLGFFISSGRAKLFRDWAEELIIQIDEQKDLFGVVPVKKALPAKRKHNRLTQERMVSILADICRIEDAEIRMSITNKLMGGQFK